MNKSRTSAASCALVAALLLALPTRAISQASSEQATATTHTSATNDYRIAASDVLTVSVPDAPEFSGKFRVSDSGVIEIPGVTAPVRAAGHTAIELAHSIREALVDSKQLRDPRVSVFVEESHGRTITILGAVTKPSVYPLVKRTNVLEALSLAGGALPNSGNTVTIVRGSASAEATNTTPGSVQILQMSDLLAGKDLATAIEVRNGDLISVSAAQLIYVVGAVVKPGGYAMSDPSSGVSVVQAVALAEGLRGVASSHAVIVRQSTNEHARTEIPVDVGQMMAGRTADMLLAPNDILYVPASGAKKTLKVMGDVAMAAVNGVALYGIGYRVGNVR